MRSVIIAILLLTSLPVYAQSAKPCEELKAEIARKLDASNVKSYTLEIVPTDKVKDTEKVVGNCDGGTKKIVYSRNATPVPKPDAEPSKP